jgi:hypothetical protein
MQFRLDLICYEISPDDLKKRNGVALGFGIDREMERFLSHLIPSG